MTSVRSFAGRPESVPAARHFVRAVLSADAPETVDAVELMVCELATNCVKHAHSGFQLLIEEAPDGIRVEVTDSGAGRPTPRTVTPSEASGRGLRIVEAMASAWGVAEAADGKTVWFTVPAVRGQWAH